MWMALSLAVLLQAPAATAPTSPPVAVTHTGTSANFSSNLSANLAASLSADLSADLDALVRKHSVPGMAAAVIIDGKLARVGAAGKRARGEPADATVNDLWHLGSCAKAMTATLAATLVDRGELRWSSTLPELFPDETIPDAWRGVTLENLLTHRAGLPATITDQALWGSLFTSTSSTRDDRRKVLRWVLSQKPGCKPGETFVYSNLGFMIAGHAIETRSDKAFEDVIAERLFAPLGITSAGLGPPKGDHPRGHRGPGPKAPPVKADEWADNPRCLGPAGAFHMTISDWARFVAFHATGELATPPITNDTKPDAKPDTKPDANPDTKPLLPPALVKALHTPPIVPGAKPGDAPATYAFGWVTTNRSWAKPGPESKGAAIMHNGSNTMWYCVAWVAPERGLAVVVACNQAGPAAERACDEAAAKFLTNAGDQKGNP